MSTPRRTAPARGSEAAGEAPACGALVDLSPPPRAARIGTGTWLGYLVFAGSGALIFGILAIHAWRDIADLELLVEDGSVTRGWITGARVRGGRHPDYIVDYAYEVGGVEHRGSTEVSESWYEKVKIGDAQTVTYLRSQPALHRPYVADRAALDLRLRRAPFVLAAVVVFTALLLVVSLVPVRRRLALARHGTAATATVLEVQRKRKHGFRVLYAFDLPGGDVGESSDAVHASEAAKLTPGTKITIVFDPQNPANNATWLGLGDVLRLG